TRARGAAAVDGKHAARGNRRPGRARARVLGCRCRTRACARRPAADRDRRRQCPRHALQLRHRAVRGPRVRAGTRVPIAPKRLHETLKADTRGSEDRSGARARGVLIVIGTALGVIVLVGAGLLLRSFLELERVPLGFRPEQILTFRAALPASRYDTGAKRTAFYQQLVERLRALPGAQSAS